MSVRSAHERLRPSLKHLHDPHLIAGMPTAIARIEAAIRSEERIRIVTDYDVDGTISSLVLQSTLRLLGAGERLDYHIPDRFVEGYGFSVIAADKAAEDGIGLIITADIGVRDHAAVQRAAGRGVDVIISPPPPRWCQRSTGRSRGPLPPQEGCPYPNKALAAVGAPSSWLKRCSSPIPDKEAILRSMLKVAAIGTVADVVDLSTPENRAIVAHGIQGLRAGAMLSLHALLEVAGVQGEVTSEDLGFRQGRASTPPAAWQRPPPSSSSSMSATPGRARAKAQELDALNGKRQQIQRKLVGEVLDKLSEEPPPCVVEWGAESEGWHRGVVGIVAAKVRDHTHRPTAIIAVAGDEARGSVRSIPGAHAVSALDSVSALLTAHGGHPAAAG